MGSQAGAGGQRVTASFGGGSGIYTGSQVGTHLPESRPEMIPEDALKGSGSRMCQLTSAATDPAGIPGLTHPAICRMLPP